jgi:hypothetical protein
MPEAKPKASPYAFGCIGLPVFDCRSKAPWLTRCLISVLVLLLFSGLAIAAPSNDKQSEVPMILQLSPDTELKGEVSKSSDPPLSERIDQLMDVAIERTGKKETLDKKDKHYSMPVQKLFAWSKDVGELVTEYKGLEQSSEAADVILNTRVKLKSKAAVELAKQLQIDEIHKQIVSSIMQIAMGLGLSDIKQRGDAVSAGVDQLRELVGEDEAAKTEQFLSDWAKLANQPVGKQPCLTILELEGKSKQVLQAAMEKDPVVLDIKKKLSVYNHRSKVARLSAKVLNTTLSITSLSPTVIAPASELAWTAFVMVNGGPEESKLLKEVYLGQRFESRWNMLNQESLLAVNGLNMATVTQNAAMAAVAKYLISKMGDEPAGAQLLSANKLVPTR